MYQTKSSIEIHFIRRTIESESGLSRFNLFLREIKLKRTFVLRQDH